MSDEQFLDFHRSSRDAVRAVLDGLSEEGLHERDAQRDFSIAEEIGHLVAAEHWFLADDLGIEPGFPHMDKVRGQASSQRELEDRLESIERRWPEILREHPDRRGVRVVLARMALHTLDHLARIVDRRVRMDPSFRLPHWSERGSWEFAIEPLLRSVRE